MELDASALNSRRGTGVPLCLSKGQKDALAAANRSTNSSNVGGSRASRHFSNGSPLCTQTNAELPPDVDRALQMFRTYPVMRVQGTAFENYLNKSDRCFSNSISSGVLSTLSAASSPVHKSGTSQVLQDAVDASTSHLESERPMTLRRGSGEGMVRLAAAVKRAAMWQTVIVAALAGYQMSDEYREVRLRKALERHMLPVLVKRREETGSIMDTEKLKIMTKRTQEQKKEAGNAPQGTYLKDHYPLFASFGNSQLLQFLADKMNRVRYVVGETIAEADHPCQHRLHVLVSGKCEVRTGHRDEKGLLTVTKSFIEAGTVFGGVFGTSATHAGTYRAVSQCIVWELERAGFEAVFTSFADATMLSTFTDALRAHNEEWLQHRYPLRPALLQRVPLYRRLPLPPATYLPDFSPVVKIRGEMLFDQGDAPDDVYVLMEGTVKRMVRGDDGTFSSGVVQLLGPTSFATFNASGRFLLLGEEPHILPGFQRYRCVVQSRAALFYRVSGERFVNAMLDDANALCGIREKLSQLYLSQMSLDPSCLSFAPILRHLPSSTLQRLASDAKPAVIGRAVSVCEPAQSIKEIYLVTLGEVRDPRSYGHVATQRLPTPPPSEGDSTDEEETDHKGHRGRKDKKAAERKGKPAAGSGAAAAAAKGRGAVKPTAAQPSRTNAAHTGVSAHSPHPEEDVQPAFSFDDEPVDITMSGSMSSTMGRSSGVLGVVAADEQEEFNPALPKRVAKRFLTTLGGGWEGLLIDKWPNGWTTTTTTEVWAIPTLSIRTEYNAAGRSAQSAILTVARQTQKEEQGLTTLPPAKLPPMSSYLTEQVAAKANLASAAAAIALATRGSSSGSGRARKKPSSRASGRPPAGGLESSVSFQDQAGGANGPGLPDIYSVNYVSQMTNSKELSAQNNSQLTSRGPAGHHDRRATRRVSKAPATSKTAKLKDAATRLAGTTAAEVSVKDRKSRAEPPSAEALSTPAPPALNPKQAALAAQARARAHRLKERGADGGDPQAAGHAGGESGSGDGEEAVSAHLMAVYRGEFDDGDPALLNVVRDPMPPKPHPKAPSQQGGGARGGATVPDHRGDAWPVSSAPGHTRWFQEVPSYEPLPGTINNRAMAVAAPEFANNTAFMTNRNGKHYQDTLMAQERYFSSTLPRDERALPSASVPSAAPQFASMQRTQQRADVPKRHAVKDAI